MFLSYPQPPVIKTGQAFLKERELVMGL